MGTNLVESTREPRIGFTELACQVDPDLGLSDHSLAFSDDRLQPLGPTLRIGHGSDV